MLTKLKRLFADTAIYGISTILGRFLNFLLVPFYTNVLVPGDYGIVAYVYSLIAFVGVLYAYGMESAYFKYTSTLEMGTPRDNFTTPFLSLLVSSAIFSALMSLLAPGLARLADLPSNGSAIVTYTAWILFLDTIVLVPFASLRMEGKAKLFAALKFANIVINVTANLVFLLIYHAGVEGIFMSGLIASASTALMLLPTIVRHFTPRFSPDLYRALLRFALPYLPAGLAAMMMQVVNRPILKALTDDATVGVFQANYKLGIFMMLMVSMFDYAWRPFFLTNASDPGAKRLFARVLTYFVLIMAAVFLVLSFFTPDLVRLQVFGRHIIAPGYWGGLSIVPVVLAAYVFLGIYNNLMPGIYIQKKTSYLPGITLAGAATNVIANFLLIPPLGMMGAGLATLLSYAVMAGVLYVVVQRIYPVAYEWGRVGKIAAAAAVVYALSLVLPMGEYHLIGKFGLLVLFALLMIWMKFFVPAELAWVKRAVIRPVKLPVEQEEGGDPGM
ncbi:MAG: Membrane protein [Bacteroidetes bacterium]|nr:Membrane protein [Bacteroidota bacterium]